MTQFDRQERARSRLAELLAAPGPLDVIQAALLVAAEEYPDLDVGGEAQRIRLICVAGAERVDGLTNPFARLDELRSYLFEDLGFRGNHDAYDDPRNSFLNEVLDRRLGIPLTLSMLFIEQARAAGFEAHGVGLPGHFVTRVRYDGRSVLVDPFHGGHVITIEDCRQLVARSTGRAALFRSTHLDGVPGSAMLKRLLLNLKQVYVSSADFDRALSAVERLLLISPGDPQELRDRGLIKAHLGRPGPAIADLERYLSLVPDAPDLKTVEGRLVWLRRKLSEIN
jgi:regulator of sirC expression with transglutaminase-like and TPR domain